MMKKALSILIAIVFLFSFVSCGDNSENYKSFSIGDEIVLAGIKFNVYKTVNDKELYLLAQNNIAFTPFSEEHRPYEQTHNYEGSLVEGYVNRFVDDLEDKGYTIKKSGIISEWDLIDLGFESATLKGGQYKLTNAPVFLQEDDHFWVDGYCRFDSYAWAYSGGLLSTQHCSDEYGVRPIIVIDITEVDKLPNELPPDLTIQEMVSLDYTWTGEGGIHNPYNRYYFDCDRMLFITVFETPETHETYEYSMSIIDDKTIQIEGFGYWYQIPAQLTIVSETKLRLRFLDEKYNDGDYFLIMENEG